ncbi:MAG: murein biosynthesis integral membrane protein MurJ [Actinomycetota bacterium]
MTPPRIASATAPGGPSPEIDIVTQDLARPAVVMAVGTTLSRITGLGRTIALVFALGVAESRLADSYNIANTLPNVLYELILGGVLTSVFIPLIVAQLRTKDRTEAWRGISALVSCAMVVLLVCTLIVVAVAPWIIDLFTANGTGAAVAEQRDLATFFLRIFALQIALYGFVAIADGLLNANGRFALPMFAPILNNLIVIGVFLLFAWTVNGIPTQGEVNDNLDQKLLLGLGTTGGVLAMALIYLPFLRQLPGKLKVNVDFRNPSVRRLAQLSAWTVAYVATNTVGFVVSFYLANAVQGGVTAYITAFAFFQLPIGIVAVSIITAIVPKLSAHHVDGDERAFAARVAGGFRACAMMMLPATAALIVLAGPMVTTLLEHGVVEPDSADLIASILRYFAIGLLPFAAYMLLMRAFYSRQDARTPALINIAENVATIALDFALFPFMKMQGLALAHSGGYFVGVGVAAWILARRVGGLELRRGAGQLVKVTVATLACAGAMVGVLALVKAGTDPGSVRALLQLILGGMAGLGTFLAVAAALKVEDLAMLRRLIPGR